RSSLRYGMCVVSIPHDHRVGHIESPSVWKLEFSEDPEKHVVLHKIYIYNKDSFFDKLKQGIQESSKKSSFLFVHGYNTSFADAAKRTAQISYDLKFDGEAVFYSWPSKESVAEYTRDESNIEWAQHDLELFLTDYISKSGAEEIYLVAHSMGNRGLTRAITNVIKEHPEYKEKIKEIILAAPDIDADVFKRDIAPKMIQTIQKPITLYVSSDDLALKASKEVHGYARAGDSGDGLVVINGIETVDATGIDTSFLSHSYFADTSSIIADIFDLIKTGKRALYRKSLQLIELSNKVYYKVVKK
ncbi:MAG: alpha/beta hydrolase, partial [Mangrovimonas sp.]|nr:alpha/beta hydrolase [Mangrovimonas sp.]